MICSACGNDAAYAIKTSYGDGKKEEYCDRCGPSGSSIGYLPDVYFKGPYLDEHLSDEKHPNGYYISSRFEKKAVMDKLRVREAGDRVHGATKFDPISHRHAMESLRRKK